MLEAFLLLLVIALLVALAFLIKKLLQMRSVLQELRFAKSSQAVKYGKLTEQFIPFTDSFPCPPERFRFIGSPIDGIAFGDEEIVFCEFKTGESRLSEKQKRIKELVQGKKVKWLEFNLR